MGHMLNRNSLLEHVIERKIKGKIEGKRRRKQLLHVLKKSIRHWNLKEEALDRTV